MKCLPHNLVAKARQTVVVILGIGCVGIAIAGEPSEPLAPANGALIDLPMLRDPNLADPPRIAQFDPGLKSLWLSALARPEYDLRVAAIRAFVEARQRGMEDLEDVLPDVLRRLEEDGQADVRLAAARAMVAFDYRDSAAALLHAGGASENIGLDMTGITDVTLARWDYEPARAVWREQASVALALAEPIRAVSAITSLGTVVDPEAAPQLRELVTDQTLTSAVRLAAARALGRCAASGLTAIAASLHESLNSLDRLIAAEMLRSHQDSEAVRVLDRLAGDPNPTVASTALQVLNGIDPQIIVPRAQEFFAHADFNVRLETARAVVTDRTVGSVRLLADRLNDSSVVLRSLARQTLINFDADVALSAAVRQNVQQQLAYDDQEHWRALEQAAFIAGVLEIKTMAARLIELLDFGRDEVRLASATAMRMLAIEQTLPALLAHTQKVSKVVKAGMAKNDYVPFVVHGREVTQLFMLFGQIEYAPAHELMRQYIPKHSYAPMTRSAAIYALGKIYEGNLDKELAGQLTTRLSDVNPMDPEFPTVRRMSAVGLARMNATEKMGTLEHFLDKGSQTADIRGSCRWAIMQMTGKQLPPLEAIKSKQSGWFLEPIE